MAVKKSQLYSTQWKSCNNQRDGKDVSLYKDYVLMVLVVTYLSDKSRVGVDQLKDIPESCHYDDIVALKNIDNIGKDMNKILGKLCDVVRELRLSNNTIIMALNTFYD